MLEMNKKRRRKDENDYSRFDNVYLSLSLTFSSFLSHSLSLLPFMSLCLAVCLFQSVSLSSIIETKLNQTKKQKDKISNRIKGIHFKSN